MSDYNALNLAERSRRPRPKTGNKDEPKVRKFQSTPDSYGLEDDDIFKDLLTDVKKNVTVKNLQSSKPKIDDFEEKLKRENLELEKQLNNDD